jgi:hypothetical protein
MPGPEATIPAYPLLLALLLLFFLLFLLMVLVAGLDGLGAFLKSHYKLPFYVSK